MTFEEECWFADSLSDEKSIEHSIPVLVKEQIEKNYLHKQKVRTSFIEIRNVIQNCSNLDPELVRLFTEDIHEIMGELGL